MLESACRSPGCSLYGQAVERYEHHADAPDPLCASCGKPTVRLVSSFAMPFCGDITARYNDPTVPNRHVTGHWGWKRRSARDWSKPERIWVDSFQKQREHCRAEGLYDPTEIPQHAEINEDGKRVCSRGMPGAWV